MYSSRLWDILRVRWINPFCQQRFTLQAVYCSTVEHGILIEFFNQNPTMTSISDIDSRFCFDTEMERFMQIYSRNFPNCSIGLITCEKFWMFRFAGAEMLIRSGMVIMHKVRSVICFSHLANCSL